jgi:uncharacterized protein (DUF1697 family)
MPTNIALLRSVNVLGKNMIKMPELARAFEVVIEKKLSANATSRNWNTCQKLLEISRE